jgi:hypothetical protein
MTLQEILNKVYSALGKDQFGGYITPDDYNAAIRYVNIEQMNDLLKVFEEKREITDDLLPFVKTIGDSDTVPLYQDSYGYVEIPEDYWYYVRSYFADSVNDCDTSYPLMRPIEFLNQADFGYRIGTDILKPTIKHPIAAIQNGKWWVLPKANLPVVFTYLRTPNSPNYDYYTQSGDIIYLPPGSTNPITGQPSTSVEFEWVESVHLNLIQLLVKYFSINIRSDFNLQTLEIYKGQQGSSNRGLPTYGNL